MGRDEIRKFLRSRRLQRRAAMAIGVSPSHLGGFLLGNDANLSPRRLVRLVDYLRTEHGLDVNVETLVRSMAAQA